MFFLEQKHFYKKKTITSPIIPRLRMNADWGRLLPKVSFNYSMQLLSIKNNSKQTRKLLKRQRTKRKERKFRAKKTKLKSLSSRNWKKLRKRRKRKRNKIFSVIQRVDGMRSSILFNQFFFSLSPFFFFFSFSLSFSLFLSFFLFSSKLLICIILKRELYVGSKIQRLEQARRGRRINKYSTHLYQIKIYFFLISTVFICLFVKDTPTPAPRQVDMSSQIWQCLRYNADEEWDKSGMFLLA